MKFLSIVLWVLVFNIMIGTIGTLHIIPSPIKPFPGANPLESKGFVVDSVGNANFANNESLLYKINTFNADQVYLKKGFTESNSLTSINDFFTSVWMFIDIFAKGTITIQATYTDMFSKTNRLAKMDLSYYANSVAAKQKCFELTGGSPTASYETLLASEADNKFIYNEYYEGADLIKMCEYRTWTAGKMIWIVAIGIQLMYLIALFQILSGRNLDVLK